MLHTRLHPLIAVTGKTNGQAWEPPKKAMLFRKPGCIGLKIIFSFWFFEGLIWIMFDNLKESRRFESENIRLKCLYIETSQQLQCKTGIIVI